MSAAEEVIVTPGMQAHIDRNNQYLADAVATSARW